MIRLTSLMRTSHDRSAGGSDIPRASTAPAWTTRSGQVSASSSTKRAIDRSMPHGSTPRSKRADASERSPSRDGRQPDADRLEPRRLQRHGRRGVVDLGVGAAHDPGDPDRAVGGVADEEVRWRQLAGHVVQRGQRLALAGEADPEARRIAQRSQVVGVVGLAELEHDVVADVDDVVDRAHPGRRQPLGHPRCGRSDDHAGEHGRREAAAAVAVDDLDRRARAARRPGAPAAGRAA